MSNNKTKNNAPRHQPHNKRFKGISVSRPETLMGPLMRNDGIKHSGWAAVCDRISEIIEEAQVNA